MKADAAGSDSPWVSPHAPERGRLARLLGPLHVTGIFWYRLHAWGVSHIPRWSVPIFVNLFTAFFFLTLRRIRRALADNLIPVLGRPGPWAAQRRIWRTMHTFAWCLTERYEQLAAPRVPHIEIEHREAWASVVGTGRGFIVLTAHIGCWEVAASVLTQQVSQRVHLVREEEIAPEAQRFVSGLVARHSAGRFVTHFAGDPRLGLELKEALAGGEIVALQGDRPRAGGQSLCASLFGHTLELPAGPFVLARLTGAPLLPAFAFREGRLRYRIAFRDAIHVAATADRRHDLARAVQAVASDMEWAVARSPFQWFCFRRAWSPGTGSTVSARSRLTVG